MAAPLMIAQTGFSILSHRQQARYAHQAAQRSIDAAVANAAAADAELSRQQREAHRVAAEGKSDRQRQMDNDLALIRTAGAEGFAMGGRLAGEAAYIAGIDLSRIEANRDGEIAALQSKKEAVSRGAQVDIEDARSRAKAASQSAFLGIIGSGIQIGANAYDRRLREKAAENTIPRR